MFMGFKHPAIKSPVARMRTNATSSVTKALVPVIPLSAVISFAVVGFGGALFLSYSFFPTATATSSSRSPNNVPVYSARPVPRDPAKAAVPEQSVSVAEWSAAAQTESEQTAIAKPASAGWLASASTRKGFAGFDGFANSKRPNTLLALAGAPMGVGVSAESNSSGHSAPDAVSLSSVPEPSTWLSGLALVALVGARWLRSKWRRSPGPPRS
jgi:hypothetical protein